MAKSRNKKNMDNAAQFASAGTVNLTQKTVNVPENWETLTADERRSALADQGLTAEELEIVVNINGVKDKAYIPVLSNLPVVQVDTEGNHIGTALPAQFATWTEFLAAFDEKAKTHPSYGMQEVKFHNVDRRTVEAAAKYEQSKG